MLHPSESWTHPPSAQRRCVSSGSRYDRLAPVDPVNAEYRIGFAPLGGRLRSRHAVVHGLGRLTAFLRQAHVPTPEIERAWRALATRRVHSIPRVGLTPTQITALGL
jgi:hypothetical protein